MTAMDPVASHGCRDARRDETAALPPFAVSLLVYRVSDREVRAHEYFGDRLSLYVGDLRLPRRRLPRARAGERIRLTVGSVAVTRA